MVRIVKIAWEVITIRSSGTRKSWLGFASHHILVNNYSVVAH